MSEIAILGAGISGLTAALTLAKAGIPVTVYERSANVGSRFNGDLQGLENYSEKEDVIQQLKRMNVEVNFDCDPFTAFNASHPKSGSESVLRREGRPLCYLVRRGSSPGCLDHGLKQQALAVGVKIRFRRTIAAADIVATGPMPGHVIGFDRGIVFETDASDMAHVLLGGEYAIHGYSYLLVTRGRGCLCTVCLGNPEELHIQDRFARTMEYYRARHLTSVRRQKPAGGIGSFTIVPRYQRGRTLFVGEAAGLQDLLWGYGMRYAVESGYLAARSIIEGVSYEELARARFERKRKASIVNRYLWERYGDTLFRLIVRHPKSMVRLLRPMHNLNPLQRLLYPRAMAYVAQEYPQAAAPFKT